MTPRTRQTTATERRISHMRLLIAEIATREMLADEIARFLGFSASGARKYIHDLRDDGVIEISRYIKGTSVSLGSPVYQLSPDQALVAAFLTALAAPAPARQQRIRPALPAKPGRTLHILADDSHYAVRLSRVAPVHDALHAAFFPVAVRP